MTPRALRRLSACGQCGSPLAGMRADAKWCSATCRSRARKDGDRPGHRARRAAWHAARGRWLRHGLDPDAAGQLLKAGCGVCGRAFDTPRLAHVDHDHSCCPGQLSCGDCVRGLLCPSCNAGIGFLGDSPARLRAAATYLDRPLLSEDQS